MSSLYALVAAKAKLAAVVAGTALVTSVVGGGGALVMSNVAEETAVVDPAPAVEDPLPGAEAPADDSVVGDPVPDPVAVDDPVVVEPVLDPEVPVVEPEVPVEEPDVPIETPDVPAEDPVAEDPVAEDPDGEEAAPVVKEPNPRAVANHNDGRGRDDERASLRGGGNRDPHAGSTKGQGKK